MNLRPAPRAEPGRNTDRAGVGSRHGEGRTDRPDSGPGKAWIRPGGKRRRSGARNGFAAIRSGGFAAQRNGLPSLHIGRFAALRVGRRTDRRCGIRCCGTLARYHRLGALRRRAFTVQPERLERPVGSSLTDNARIPGVRTAARRNLRNPALPQSRGCQNALSRISRDNTSGEADLGGAQGVTDSPLSECHATAIGMLFMGLSSSSTVTRS